MGSHVFSMNSHVVSKTRRNAGMAFRQSVRSAVAATGLGSLLFAVASGADDFDVTRTDDPIPVACVSAGDCSLREAVIAANTLGGANRVLLPPGTYILTLAGAAEDLGATGDLDCDTGDLEFRGLGATPADTVIDATGLGDRILDLLGFCDARILDLTLRGGTETDGGAIRSVGELTIRRAVFDRNTATDDGGAIMSQGITARATVEDTTFSDNVANRAGAVMNEGASTFVIARSTFTGNVATDRGGAIFNQNDGAVTLTDSHLENNRAEDAGEGQDGGAIFTQNTSSFTIVRSVITGNLAEEAGGAIFVQNDSALTILETTISGNTALGTEDNEGGGAIYCNNDSALVIERSTISGNHSDGDAGGISRNNDGQLLLHNSTVTGNTAGRNGGGLLFDSFGGSAHIAVESSTITDNSAAGQGGGVWNEGDPEFEAGFLNTIIVENFASGAANDCDTDGIGLFVSKGFNLDGTDTCGLDQGSDQPAATALLGPLEDNGGPTLTHSLLDGSPAIDTGTPDPLGPEIDQRGVVRPQGVGRDIGSVERTDTVASLCTAPATAVEDWKGEVPVGACGDAAESEKLCRAWLKTCKRLVKAAASCRNTELASVATLGKAQCKISDVGDVQQCKGDVVAELQQQKAATKTEKIAGRMACEEHVDDCRVLCEG